MKFKRKTRGVREIERMPGKGGEGQRIREAQEERQTHSRAGHRVLSLRECCLQSCVLKIPLQKLSYHLTALGEGNNTINCTSRKDNSPNLEQLCAQVC